jgi:hypothetical protein
MHLLAHVTVFSHGLETDVSSVEELVTFPILVSIQHVNVNVLHLGQEPIVLYVQLQAAAMLVK